MSQLEVYKIIKELGGEATTKQIRELALKKFPDLSLHSYVYNRLNKLEKNGYIKRRRGKNEIVWIIIDEYP